MAVQERIQIIIEAIDKNVTKTINKLGPTFQKMTKSGERFRASFKKTIEGMKGFKMEMLSVMFFGYAIAGFFSGLINPALEAYGVFDLWNVMLLTVFIPILDILFPILLGIMEWFMNLPEGAKVAIGVIAVLGVIFGTLMGVIGTVALGIGGLLMALGVSFGTLVAVVAAVFSGIVFIVVGFIRIFKGKWDGLGLIILGIGVILLLFIGWWALIPIAVGAVIFFLINRWTQVKEFFRNLWEGIKNIFTSAWNFIRDIVTNIWNWVVNMVNKIISKVGGIFGLGGGTTSIKTYGDMVWRPGQAPVAVSPNDTLIATKGGGAGGSILNFAPVYNVTVADRNEFERMIEHNNSKLVDDLRRMVRT